MSQGTTYSQHLARLLRDYEALVVDLGFLREFRSRACLLGADQTGPEYSSIRNTFRTCRESLLLCLARLTDTARDAISLATFKGKFGRLDRWREQGLEMEYRCWCRDCGAWAGQASGLAVSLYRDEVLAHNLIEASGRKRLPADVPSGAYALKAGDMLDHADAGGRLLSRLKYLGGYGRHQHPDLSLQERADRDFEGHLAAARREHGALLDLLRP